MDEAMEKSVPISQDVAIALWRSVINGPASGDRIPFVSTDMEAALDALLQVPATNLDGSEFSHMVLGDKAAGNLLSVCLWQAGLGNIPMEHARCMVRLLLDRGCNPNALIYGHKPVDMLVVGVHNSSLDPPPDITSLVELLVSRGMNHDQPGAYSPEQLEGKLRQDCLPEEMIDCMFKGPAAVALDRQTCDAPAPPRRRQL